MTAYNDESATESSCCTTTDPSTATVEALDSLKSQDFTLAITSLRTAGFQLLLEKGAPIDTTEWSTAAGIDETALQDTLERHGGRIQLDDKGCLVGIAGLTIQPTRHRVTISGEDRWTWCALDAVGILGALRATGSVRSVDPQTDEVVRIDFKDGHPQCDATLFIAGGYDGGNVREEWCPLVNFFTDRRHAEAWSAANTLEGDIVSVTRIVEDAAAIWQTATNPEQLQAY